MRNIDIIIDYDLCDYCMECVDICDSDALLCKDKQFVFDIKKCTYCESCMDVCPEEALRIIEL